MSNAQPEIVNGDVRRRVMRRGGVCSFGLGALCLHLLERQFGRDEGYEGPGKTDVGRCA